MSFNSTENGFLKVFLKIKKSISISLNLTGKNNFLPWYFKNYSQNTCLVPFVYLDVLLLYLSQNLGYKVQSTVQVQVQVYTSVTYDSVPDIFIFFGETALPSYCYQYRLFVVDNCYFFMEKLGWQNCWDLDIHFLDLFLASLGKKTNQNWEIWKSGRMCGFLWGFVHEGFNNLKNIFCSFEVMIWS